MDYPHVVVPGYRSLRALENDELYKVKERLKQFGSGNSAIECNEILSENGN